MTVIKTRPQYRNVIFNKAIRILLLTNGLILMAAAMLGPIYALFVEEIGGDLLDASLAGSVYALMAGVTVLVTGKYADKVKDKKKIVAAGYFVMGLGYLLYTQVSSIYFLLFVQVIIGLGEAIYAPSFDAVYSAHLDLGKDGIEWGAWEAMNYFTIALGAIIGGVIVKFYGFGAVFIIMAILCFASAIYTYSLPKRIL